MPRLWQLADNHAQLALPRLTARLDPRRPADGLTSCEVDHERLEELALLGVDLSAVESRDADALDCYVREGDLIATYPERPRPAMRAQLYWRAAAHPLDGAIAAIELVASVQTSLLDSCPRLLVHSALVVRDILRLVDAARGAFAPVKEHDDAADGFRADCFLFRLPDERYSYVEMILPDDGQATRLRTSANAAGSAARLEHQLFAERLEKGVILRARVLGLVIDRDGDEAAAARHNAAFQNGALPLTA